MWVVARGIVGTTLTTGSGVMRRGVMVEGRGGTTSVQEYRQQIMKDLPAGPVLTV